MKKISIVTINFNDCKGLIKTLESVFNQKSNNYEIIVIDGGSSDGSVDVIKKYESLISYCEIKPDNGIYNAMNKGINHSRGEWIFFLNSGDIFASNDVLQCVNFNVDDEVGAIYGRYKYYDRYDKLQLNDVKNSFTTTRGGYRSMGFSHQSVFVRTSLAKEFMFDETYKLCADYNMMMQIYKAGYKFLRDNTIISICDGRGGISYNNRNLQDYEIARVCECEKQIIIRIKLHIKKLIRPIYRKIKKIQNI